MNKFFLISYKDEHEQIFEERAETKEEALELKESLEQEGWKGVKIREIRE